MWKKVAIVILTLSLALLKTCGGKPDAPQIEIINVPKPEVARPTPTRKPLLPWRRHGEEQGTNTGDSQESAR
jgi:hypothetical protein